MNTRPTDEEIRDDLYECAGTYQIKYLTELADALDHNIVERQAAMDGDKQRMDWLEEKVSEGVVEMAFDIDGGIFFDLHTVGNESVSFNSNDVRESIDRARNGDIGSNNIRTHDKINVRREIMRRIGWLQVGTCSCMTKTPDIKHHDEHCNYRVAREIEMLLSATHTTGRDGDD